MAKSFEETKRVSTVRGFLKWKDGRNLEVVFKPSKKGNVEVVKTPENNVNEYVKAYGIWDKPNF